MVTKHEVEKVIVPRPSTAIPTAGDLLFDPATNALNLPVGGFGFYIDAPGSSNPIAVTGTAATGVFNTGTTGGLPATIDAATTPVRIIMRRDTTNDASVLPPRYLEQSDYIDASCRQGILIGGEGYVVGTSSSWLIGAPAGQTGDVNVLNQSNYALQVSAHGYRTDMTHGVHNTPTAFGRFTSPNWADTSYTTAAQQLDFTIASIVEDFNRQSSVSSQQSIAFAVAISSTGGVGLDFDAFVAGTTVVIGYDSFCNPINLLITEDRKAAFDALTARLTADFSIVAGTATLVPYVLPSHCSAAPAGQVFSGTTATADMIFTVALDTQLAAYDELPQTRRRINASLMENESLSTDTARRQISNATEEQGSSRNLRLMYDNVEHYKSYTSSRKWGANHVAYGDEIVDGAEYSIYTVQSCANRVASSGMPSFSPRLVTIGIGGDATQKAYVEAALGAIATSAGLQPVTL